MYIQILVSVDLSNRKEKLCRHPSNMYMYICLEFFIERTVDHNNKQNFLNLIKISLFYYVV